MFRAYGCVKSAFYLIIFIWLLLSIIITAVGLFLGAKLYSLGGILLFLISILGFRGVQDKHVLLIVIYSLILFVLISVLTTQLSSQTKINREVQVLITIDVLMTIPALLSLILLCLIGRDKNRETETPV